MSLLQAYLIRARFSCIIRQSWVHWLLNAFAIYRDLSNSKNLTLKSNDSIKSKPVKAKKSKTKSKRQEHNEVIVNELSGLYNHKNIDPKESDNQGEIHQGMDLDDS